MLSPCGIDLHNFYWESSIIPPKSISGQSDASWLKSSWENHCSKEKLNSNNLISTSELLALPINNLGPILNHSKTTCTLSEKNILQTNFDKWYLKTNSAIKESNFSKPYLLQIPNKELLPEKHSIMLGSKRISLRDKICPNTIPSTKQTESKRKSNQIKIEKNANFTPYFNNFK